MPKEKPVTEDRTAILAKAITAFKASSDAVENPYTSERHKKAVQRIRDRNIPVRALRGSK